MKEVSITVTSMTIFIQENKIDQTILYKHYSLKIDQAIKALFLFFIFRCLGSVPFVRGLGEVKDSSYYFRVLSSISLSLTT